MDEDQPILSLELEAIPPNRAPLTFRLEVQQPYLEGGHLWRCVVTMGSFQKPLRIGGGDAFQALCLAIDFARWTLEAFEAEGGELMHEGERFPLEAYFFKAPD